MNSLAETIRYMRQRRGLSAAALSRQAGYSPSYIAKLESGDLEPSLGAFASIAKALEFSDAEIAFTVRMMCKERP